MQKEFEFNDRLAMAMQKYILPLPLQVCATAGPRPRLSYFIVFGYDVHSRGDYQLKEKVA